ncbi:hypothetical protein MMC14_008394 [Varicellaria rhodocarpa]|nr:hypothetical protein [Varicellaria rhodocarpa]
MKEKEIFCKGLYNAKISLMFATVNEPLSVARGSFKFRDKEYAPKKFERGVSSNVSSRSTPMKKAKPQQIGFVEEDDEVLPQSVFETETPPVTPTAKNVKPLVLIPKSSPRGVVIGFAGDSSLDKATAEESRIGLHNAEPSSDNAEPTKSELENMSYVSDFIDGNSEYGFPDSVKADIHECERTGRADGRPLPMTGRCWHQYVLRVWRVIVL